MYGHLHVSLMFSAFIRILPNTKLSMDLRRVRMTSSVSRLHRNFSRAIGLMRDNKNDAFLPNCKLFFNKKKQRERELI